MPLFHAVFDAAAFFDDAAAIDAFATPFDFR